MKICKGKKKIREFKNIAINILKPEENKELINEGCFIPDCRRRSWKVRNQKNVEERENGSLLTGFQFEMPPNTKGFGQRRSRALYPIKLFC